MQRINLQVALDKKLRDKADKKAELFGFDNLASMVRYFVVNVVNGRLEPTNLKPKVYVDAETEAEIGLSLKDYKNGRYTTLRSKKEIEGHHKKLRRTK